jgi:N-acetylneuraminic acid mutarotase
MRRLRLPLGFLTLAILAAHDATAFAQCAAGAWVTLAPMNVPRQELAAAELDGRVYAVGGLGGRANANEIYDVETDTWTLGADLPVGTDHAWAAAHGDRVFVGGGTSNRVFSYDPAFDAWTEVASSAFVHGGTPAAAVIGGLVYVAGGAGGGMAGNEVEAYDPSTDRWTTLASMRCARNHTAGGVIGGKLYVAGGRPGNQACLEVYDPASNTWTTKTSMPTGRSGVAGAVFGNCLYVFGGEGNAADPNGIFHEVEAYDPATDSWSALPPMQTGRHGIYAAVLGNTVYLPGGAVVQGLGTTGVNEAYVIDLTATAPRQPILLSSPRPRPTPRARD